MCGRTVTTVNDEAVDGDAAYTVVVGTAVSTDPEYAGRDPANLAVVNLDDGAGFIYSLDATTDTINRSRQDGSCRDVILDLKAAYGGLDYGPTRLVADATGDKLYWIDTTTDGIYRVNLDGSAPQ